MHRLGGDVHDFEDAVTDHHVGRAGRNHVEKCGGVTEDTADSVADVGLRRTTFQRGESVRAGVDHEDVMAELGDPDGQAAGASTEVDHLEGSWAISCRHHLVPRLEHPLQGVPDHGGPDRAPAFDHEHSPSRLALNEAYRRRRQRRDATGERRSAGCIARQRRSRYLSGAYRRRR